MSVKGTPRFHLGNRLGRDIHSKFQQAWVQQLWCDGTGPADESKKTKRVQGWSCQIGGGCMLHSPVIRNLLCARFMIYLFNIISHHAGHNIEMGCGMSFSENLRQAI